MTTMRLLAIGLLLGALWLTGCRSAQTNHNATAAVSPAPVSSAAEVKSRIDVCNLLSSEDLKDVQGEAYQDAQRSDRLEGAVIVGQCYYALPTTVNSVVINVTTTKDEAQSLRGLWDQRFGAAGSEGREEREQARESREREKTKAQSPRERGNEEEEKGAAPERVRDVGDEAFWVGSPVGGALYVLKRNLFFRISVGGAGDQKTKLNKSKTLAVKILKKL